ncbi:MAG: hypothetical protein H3C43_05530 [Leptonema sp. (in: Bacteria)]|nr:hypothetical protein [Leptonema sp. (in: bacteria)]
MKRVRFHLVYVTLLITLLAGTALEAQSVAEKTTRQRDSLILSLRKLRPMVYNFPCDPMPECLPADAEQARKNPGENVSLYRKSKQLYQEGLIYYFEKNFVNAYSRFLESQVAMDKLLENLSQSYLDRTDYMIRAAIEKKNPNDINDMAVVDISMDFGANSKLQRDFHKDRNIQYDVRRYDPRNYHWAVNKYRIEKNMEKGYEHLGLARKARERALQLDAHLPPQEKTSIGLINRRSEIYLQVIDLCRKAKINAEFIFALKYPYENYALSNPYGKTEATDDKAGEIPSLHGVKMNFSQNPNVMPKNLHPLFDFRVPQEWHRDTVDARELRYDDEIDVQLRFRYHKGKKPVEILEDNSDRPDSAQPSPET